MSMPAPPSTPPRRPRASQQLPWFLQSNEGSLEFGDTDNAAASLQLQRGAEENGMPSSPETASNDMDQGSPAAMLARELGAIDMSVLWWCKPLRARFLPMLHVPTFATTDAHERYCRGVIEPAGMVTHSETTVGLERRALEAIQRLGFREAEILAVNGQVQKAEAFRKMIRANMLHRDKDRMWGPVRARGPSELRHLDFGRFQRMTEPSTSSSGPYAAAGSQQARGSVHATTARVPADYSGAMDHTRAHYEKFMDTLLQLSGGFLSPGWFPLEDLQDAGGMTWEDVDEAAKVWAERNRIEISDGRVRMLD